MKPLLDAIAAQSGSDSSASSEAAESEPAEEGADVQAQADSAAELATLKLRSAQLEAVLSHYATDLKIDDELAHVTGLSLDDDGKLTGEAQYRPGTPAAPGTPSGKPADAADMSGQQGAGGSGGGGGSGTAEAPPESVGAGTSPEAYQSWREAKAALEGDVTGGAGVSTIDPSQFANTAGVPQESN